MKRKHTFCRFCIEYSWAIFLLLSLVIIFACSTDGKYSKLLNISYSLFAAALFDLVLVYIPRSRKVSFVKDLVDSDFFRLCEYARLCRLSIEPAYSLEKKNWRSKEEYVAQFNKTNLYEVWSKSEETSATRLQRIVYLRNEMKDTIDHLMMYREYLNMDQFEALTQILSSKLFKSPIEPIVWEIPEETRIHKFDNQKEIGESIYEVYDFLRMLN